MNCRYFSKSCNISKLKQKLNQFQTYLFLNMIHRMYITIIYLFGHLFVRVFGTLKRYKNKFNGFNQHICILTVRIKFSNYKDKSLN